MDGSNIDHSDSDSGDSWTILDNSPTYADDAPEIVAINPILEIDKSSSNIEKDEDTDGISIISDSDPELFATCEKIEDIHVTEESDPKGALHSPIISFSPLTSDAKEVSISNEDDFLGDTAAKHKTYVHRKNKRLSTVLNIIMLGSVITAAGVAIGHMWGARNDCSMHSTPSINKILSNLYKLQEENTFLRNKLKELTVINSLQTQQRKLNAADKLPFKHNRCKKIYEEPLNKNTAQHTKCIDGEINFVDNNQNNHLLQPEYQEVFRQDVEKLKHIYQQNRSWLDEEVGKRMKYEKESIKKMAKRPLSSITEEQKVLQDDNIKIQTNIQDDKTHLKNNLTPNTDTDIESNITDNTLLTEKKVTYADSLKSDNILQKVQKRDIKTIEDREPKYHIKKRKLKKSKDVTINDVNLSEEDFKKDDRYIGQKSKQERKKRDRQKLHKKQKRRNKYEQWEMKGGYMKDYDDVSTSFQQSESVPKNFDDLNREFENTNYVKEIMAPERIPNINLNNDLKETKKLEKGNKNNGYKNEDSNWYDKRASLRTEARNRLERELFGETSPNNAVWYFRRMQKREQCRAKNENNAYKKLHKRNKNYKMKH